MCFRKLAIYLFSLVASSLWALPCMALELRAGQSWFEQGDFLLHPGVQLSLENEARQSIRFEFTGRKFGHFTEMTSILSLNFPYDILPWEAVYTTYGLSLMDEYTGYDSPTGKDESIHSMNLGANLGLGWKVIEYKGFNARLEWNSHIFAAGLAFVYMTTARKSVLTAAIGYEL
jgi:hypothetical protein